MEKNITLKIDINMTLKEIKLFNLDLIKYIVPKFKKKFYTVELFKVFFFFLLSQESTQFCDFSLIMVQIRMNVLTIECQFCYFLCRQNQKEKVPRF